MLPIYSEEEVRQNTLVYFNNNEPAADVWMNKYCLKDLEDNFRELTPNDTHMRLAKEFARIEQKYPNPQMDTQDIFDLFKNFEHLIPQGSPISSIGNPFQIQSASNCFVIDSPEDSYGGIMKTDQELVQLAKRRGGIGFALNTLRPKKSVTHNSSRTSTGAVHFAQRYSNSTEEVGQDGRRGALMLMLSVHHPDIIQFITAKTKEGKINSANVSVQITDKFMKAVKNNTDYEQYWIDQQGNKKGSRKANAREVWNLIIESAWASAEPGVFFIDNARRMTPSDAYPTEKTICTNPCVTGDTWVHTLTGPKHIKDLLDENLNHNFTNNIIVNGKRKKCESVVYSGNKEVYMLKTERGYSLKATGNHKIKTPSGWEELRNLNPSDVIELSNHGLLNWVGHGNFKEGWIVGSIVGDGGHNPKKYQSYMRFWGEDSKELISFAKACCKDLYHVSDIGYESNGIYNISSKAITELANKYIEPKTKKARKFLEEASSNFYRGFITGLFDADGSIQGDLKKGMSIRLSQSNYERLQLVQRMLSRLGIISTIYKERRPEQMRMLPDGKGSLKEYKCKAQHELVISKDQIDLYEKHIGVGFVHRKKGQRLYEYVQNKKRKSYKTKYTDRVHEIVPLGYEDVYDVKNSEVHEFCANGIRVHNCGEIGMPAYDSCRLLAMNLYGYIINPFTKDAKFNWTKFIKHARLAQRLMDNLVDLELELVEKIIQKIKSDPEDIYTKKVELDLWQKIYAKGKSTRRTGLGITGLGDCLAALGIRYGSDKSIEMTEEIYKTLAMSSYTESIELARERGAFPLYKYHTEKDHPFIKRILSELGQSSNLAYETYGRRNICNLTTAPVGSLSMLALVTNGIENAFYVEMDRKKKMTDSEEDCENMSTDKTGQRWKHYTFYHPKYLEWMKITGKDKFEDSPYYKAMVSDVDYKKSVEIQAVAQKWVCHSISKTCNLPKDVTKELVGELYMEAYEKGCKGFTVYREGSRDAVISETKNKLKYIDATKRDKELKCDIHRSKIQGKDWVIIVGLIDGKPYEVMGGLEPEEFKQIKTNKGIISKRSFQKRSKYDLLIDKETIFKDIVPMFENKDYATHTRMISLCLRHGVKPSFLCEQLKKDDSEMFSFSKVVARVLKKYVEDGTEVTSKEDKTQCNCNEPENCKFVYIEGCATCLSCGYAKCG